MRSMWFTRHGSRFGTLSRFVLAASVVSGCASAPVRSATATPTSCDGSEIAVVRNETGEPLEIFVFSGRAEVLLGTARAGRNEFGLPPQDGGRRAFNARTQTGTMIPLSRPSQSPASRVTIGVECR